MNGEIVTIQNQQSDIEETDDGGVIVTFEQETTIIKERSFYDNIVSDFDLSTLSQLSLRLLEEVERDKESRKKRDKQYEEAIKRTGLGKEAPGGADFEGASKAVHPMLTEACVDFESRTISELMPPNGPVKSYVPGDEPTQDRLEKAERKKNYMNWQFLVQMPEFRNELEQLLTQLPLGGSQYLRLVFCHKKQRPVPTFIPIDDVYLPYAATDFYSADRMTFAEYISKYEYESRVESGLYDASPFVMSSEIPETSDAQKATDKIEGRDAGFGYNEDGLRIIYQISTDCELEDKYGYAPYLITIDEVSKRIVSIIRNWEESDEKKIKMEWIIEFPFIPWRGVYSIGLGQMIGSLSGAATGALRALLDSAHINNIPTLLRLKGANFSGQNQELNVSEVTEIEGGIAANDIRQLIMPVPYNPPSNTLFSLLGFLVDAGKGVVRTTFEKLQDQNPNMPVGTTLALIEEGMKTMGAIHLRLYQSMQRVLKVLNRINRFYLDDDQVKDDTGEILARRRDFELPLDVVPVADPQIFSDVQRLAQLQIISERALQKPEIYDQRKVEERILERTKIPNHEELLIPLEEVGEKNAVNENAAMSLGRPVAAFPDQDHLAHLQVHLDYMNSPYLGSLPIIAPTFISMCLEHIKEHITLWYVSTVSESLRNAMNKDEVQMSQILAFRDNETRSELDKTLAALSQTVVPQASQVFASLPQVIQQAMQTLQSLQPEQPQIPQDPNQMAEIQARSATEQMKIQARMQADQQKLASDKELAFLKLNAEQQQQAIQHAQQEARLKMEYAARLVELQEKERASDERTQIEVASRERINQQDNETALKIAAAEIATGERVSVSTGSGINP